MGGKTEGAHAHPMQSSRRHADGVGKGVHVRRPLTKNLVGHQHQGRIGRPRGQEPQQDTVKPGRARAIVTRVGDEVGLQPGGIDAQFAIHFARAVSHRAGVSPDQPVPAQRCKTKPGGGPALGHDLAPPIGWPEQNSIGRHGRITRIV